MKDKQKPVPVATDPIFHLVQPASSGKSLCGEAVPDAQIGSYVERLDSSTPESVHWVREVIGGGGKPVTPCPLCLSLYPSILHDVVPFALTINVIFRPNKLLRGYDVTASASAAVGDRRENINVSPRLGYFSAKWIGSLEFNMDVDANRIVPLVEQANKTKR